MDQKQSNKPAIVSCEDLYRQVWETPMLHLGIQYGISGNGLKKICDRLKVPYRCVGSTERRCNFSIIGSFWERWSSSMFSALRGNRT
jgi:hypothetical protein